MIFDTVDINNFLNTTILVSLNVNNLQVIFTTIFITFDRVEKPAILLAVIQLGLHNENRTVTTFGHLRIADLALCLPSLPPLSEMRYGVIKFVSARK